MRLDDAVTVLPILHGRARFAAEVRAACLAGRFDCIAVDLPASFSGTLEQAVDDLPYVSAVVRRSPDDPLYFVPVDPCDAAIEAIRQARQERIPCVLAAHPALAEPEPLAPLPDEHAATLMGFDEYAALLVHAVAGRTVTGYEEQCAQHIAHQLHQLRLRYRSILAVIHLRHFTRVLYHYGLEQTHNLSFDQPPSAAFDTCAVNPDHLYFVLGELPFVTGRLERTRHDPFAAVFDPVRAMKDLFVETRDEYAESREDVVELSPARIQAALTFLRNLTVQSGAFLPSLFDIVAAAKGVGANSYALRVLKNARYYPYLPIEQQGAWMAVGIDRVRLPDETRARPAVNLLRDTALSWVRLPLKPDPTARRRQRYRYHWNPLGMCSHVPEDRRIESFNTHVREKARRALCEDLARSEKFTASMRDGVDARETMRNWYTGDIYVRELPPARGDMDTIVIIFDHGDPQRYPHRSVWYAEHEEESTLTFYATDPMADLIGPGIARARYGGLSLLFPPRPIPDIFRVTRAREFPSLAHQLTCGALRFSRQKHVAYVSSVKPDLALRTMASRERKHLVWIPLSSFGGETLRRLQRFHILNGRTVRSWASRFVGD